MKEVWKDLYVKDIVKLNYGKGLPKSERNPDGAYPVYGANGIMDWSDKVLATGPSIVIGRKGSAGELKVAKGPFWPSDVTYFTTHDPSAVDFEYLYYLLQYLNLPSLAKGVKPGINRNDVYSLKIPIPPLDEQKRIVSILDQAFEGLDCARANAEANLESAQELFGASVDNAMSSVNEIKRLDEICDVRDGTHDTPKYVVSGFPLVTQKNIRRNGLTLNNVKYIDAIDHASISKRSKVDEGDILISMIGANRGMACLVDTSSEFSIKNVGLIKNNPNVCMRFLNLFLASRNAVNYVANATNGGAQPFIGLGKLRAFPVLVPSREKQSEIAFQLSALKAKVSAMEEAYGHVLFDLEELKQSLLQKAFSGELT